VFNANILTLLTRKIFNTVCKSRRLEALIWNYNHSVRSTSIVCSDVILHSRLGLFLFFSDELWNPWQMLAEPLGSAEPWLKITDVQCHNR